MVVMLMIVEDGAGVCFSRVRASSMFTVMRGLMQWLGGLGREKIHTEIACGRREMKTI